jgi:small subunit ribosomal protein S1
MTSVNEVRIARRTGFCYGVREAIDAARISAAEGNRTHTLGQVVHNEGVISQLRDQGIVSVKELDEVDEGAAVVIRAHGVTPDVMDRAEDKGLDVIDGTCSWVTQEQKELAKLVEEGYTIVLLGTPNHPEVVGLLGYAPEAILVDEEEDWAQIPRRKRMALLTQSTQPPWKFEKLAGYLTTRAHELKIVNTVCPVTIRRQQDTTDLAEAVDLVVVVGGRNSANTKELTRLVGIVGKPAMQIERARDLEDAAIFEGRTLVGVTGGTSTPIEDLEAVAARIYELAGSERTRSDATRLAREAVTAVAESAYRSSSLSAA